MSRLPALVGLLTACQPTPAPVAEPLAFRALTMNAGTTDGLAHDDDLDDGYTSAEAAIADALYENSLAWNPAEDALIRFFAETVPDLAVFQELYWDGWCTEIEVDPALDFVCRDWTADRPLQIQRLLPGYHVVCAPGQPDNCAAVHPDFGRFRDCADDLCLEGLDGKGPPNGCSNGARVGRAVISLIEGGELTLVNVHGTSGLDAESQACRAAQFEQVFVDRGDGEPAASGARNLVMGDLNTDPIRLAGLDPSADRWSDFVGDGRAFHSLTEMDGPPTYGGLFTIDHIASDTAEAVACAVAGVTEGVPAVMDAIYWDHKPVYCDAVLP